MLNDATLDDAKGAASARPEDPAGFCSLGGFCRQNNVPERRCQADRLPILGLTDASCTSAVSGLPPWLQRWNFIERARHERVLWEAFEQGQDIDGLVQQCRQAVEAGNQDRAFELEVWSTTLTRIRKIERMMGDQRKPPGDAG